MESWAQPPTTVLKNAFEEWEKTQDRAIESEKNTWRRFQGKPWMPYVMLFAEACNDFISLTK